MRLGHFVFVLSGVFHCACSRVCSTCQGEESGVAVVAEKLPRLDGVFYGVVWIGSHPMGAVRIDISEHGSYLYERDYGMGGGLSERGRGTVEMAVVGGDSSVHPTSDSHEWFTVRSLTNTSMEVNVLGKSKFPSLTVQLAKVAGAGDSQPRYVQILRRRSPTQSDRDLIRRASYRLRLNGIPSIVDLDVLEGVLVPEVDLVNARSIVVDLERESEETVSVDEHK